MQPKPPAQEVTFASESNRPAVAPAPVIKPFAPAKTFPLKPIIIGLAIVVAGIASGYGLTKVAGKAAGLKSATEVAKTGIKVGDVVGSTDEKSFRDQATGVLVLGGVDGEGSHHLIREGGPSQNVYLTSSVVDLNLFIDHKIQVWGETFSAQTAGWLMDVGRVKVLELNATKPFEEEAPTE